MPGKSSGFIDIFSAITLAVILVGLAISIIGINKRNNITTFAMVSIDNGGLTANDSVGSQTDTNLGTANGTVGEEITPKDEGPKPTDENPLTNPDSNTNTNPEEETQNKEDTNVNTPENPPEEYKSDYSSAQWCGPEFDRLMPWWKDSSGHSTKVIQAAAEISNQAVGGCRTSYPVDGRVKDDIINPSVVPTENPAIMVPATPTPQYFQPLGFCLPFSDTIFSFKNWTYIDCNQVGSNCLANTEGAFCGSQPIPVPPTSTHIPPQTNMIPTPPGMTGDPNQIKAQVGDYVNNLIPTIILGAQRSQKIPEQLCLDLHYTDYECKYANQYAIYDLKQVQQTLQNAINKGESYLGFGVDTLKYGMDHVNTALDTYNKAVQGK